MLQVTLTQLDRLCSAGGGNFLAAAALSGTSGLYQTNEISPAESGAKPVFDRRRRLSHLSEFIPRLLPKSTAPEMSP